MTAIKANILQVEVQDIVTYKTSYFEVYEFSNGLILVPGSQTNGWFFDDRDSIEANGSDLVVGIKEEDACVQFERDELLAFIQGSMFEFGVNAVPPKHAELWRKKR